MKLILIVLLFSIAACSTHNKHWSYDGSDDPSHWAEISETYRECAIGEEQSPINLSLNKVKSKDHTLKFYYHPTPAVIVNNGHTIEFDMEEDNILVADSKRYILKQFHFHSPSEHTIDGKHFAGELHLVHQAKDNSLAVVGVLIETGNGKKFNHIFDQVPAKSKTINTDELHLEALIEKSNAHFYYQGSLTTPPCSEHVKWIVLDRHLKLSKEQLKHFTDFYDHNNRSTQAIHKRAVFHSSH